MYECIIRTYEHKYAMLSNPLSLEQIEADKAFMYDLKDKFKKIKQMFNGDVAAYNAYKKENNLLEYEEGLLDMLERT